MTHTEDQIITPSFGRVFQASKASFSQSAIGTLFSSKGCIVRQADIVSAKRDRDFGVLEVRLTLSYQTHPAGPLLKMNRLVVLDICQAQSAKERRDRLHCNVFEMARLIMLSEASELSLAA